MPYCYHDYGSDAIMYIVYFATHPQHYKRGIGTGSLKAVLELARKFYKEEEVCKPIHPDAPKEFPSQTNVDFLGALFTTPISQKMAKKLNWEEVKDFYYKDFTYKGQTFASKLPEDNQKALYMARDVNRGLPP